MAWYPAPTNTTVGIQGLISALNTGLIGLGGTLSGNLFALTVLIPGWIIIFLPLAKFSPEAAFTVASFICTIVTVFLLAQGYVHILVFMIFLTMTLAGLLGYYLHTRQ